ncbi:DUF4406 domain-containing protein [Flavobacterium sp. UMI-01]|uniref:DUF4406 domain-containing protein n=1 Tax=Flavobacterium sp. UMI-01 TaxID=1441053 RepID=UPI001C7DE03B|nr:DUF4406 domain-containing protein [Flavobacterium sp. UMI-01]GIZ10004.1 phage protein [Flavobacterium sp. UMI-01]
MKQKIYIAGKVTGLPQEECTMNFDVAQAAIEKIGYEAVNPLKVVNDWNASWEVAMRKCIAALMECDLILMLDNYTNSPGARIELDLAKRLGIPCIYNHRDIFNISYHE